MLFYATVVVCLAGIEPHLCRDRDVARVLPVPGEHLGWSACMIAGMQWAAMQGARPDKVRIVCQVGKRTEA
jgi:hypothetical protein